MSRSRRVSATTSLPKPGALEPAWLGRSIAAISGWAELPGPAASRLDFAMGHYSLAVGKNCGPIQPDHSVGRNPRHPTEAGPKREPMPPIRGRLREGHGNRSGTLAQPRQQLDAGVAVGRLHADLQLDSPRREDGVPPGAPVGAVGIEAERGE